MARLALLMLLVAAAAQAQPGRQTMKDAANAFKVCRQIAKSDRDQTVGRQAAQAWLDSAPTAAQEAMPRDALLQSMVRAYSKEMRKQGQLIAMGCSQGVLERELPRNWSSFHQGVRSVLLQQGMGALLVPGKP
ncbi:MAG: hypothetical protein DBW85_09725 [Synechococcus sp. MED-G71]|jgi:hypothetical protein|nr:MAG: hypothetical protein DBW85_09725 [Synechococcus sp. MED-G71]RPF77423.1 MAG: hypothetical protein CBD15_003125 [Synechococcus sp. TMED155]|tara:strand:- start:297 stop:695 length:399 start_codon:yes stop_codon:yes gene_type:complete